MAEDEWARTERRAPVFDAEELAGAPNQPGAKKERDVVGPAWAGTLPKLEAHPQPPPQALASAAPQPSSAQTPHALRGQPSHDVSIEDAAPTQYQLPAEPPRAPLPPVQAGSDLPLMIAVSLIGVAIVLVIVGLVIVMLSGS